MHQITLSSILRRGNDLPYSDSKGVGGGREPGEKGEVAYKKWEKRGWEVRFPK